MKNIVSTLIEQHKVLKQEITMVLDIASQGNPDFEKIIQGLEKFKQDLVEHLDLENNVFYVQLLKKMKANSQNTDQTEQFIAEMKNIEKIVLAFLEKFDQLTIKEKIDEFRKELAEIIDALVLRIESEESGVYMYWG